MLEMLLVLVVGATILTVSVRYYFQYQQQVVLKQVQMDVSELNQALAAYYFQTGCHDGRFAGNLAPEISQLPTLSNAIALPAARMPVIAQYQVAIVDTGQQTKANKHIYQLQVSATISVDAPLPAAVYAKQLHATQDGQTISWQLLPSMRPQESDGALWLLNARRRNFKELEGGLDTNCAA